MYVYTHMCTYPTPEVLACRVYDRICVYCKYMYVLYVFARICMYCMYLSVCTYMFVLYVYVTICTYMYLYACISVYVRIVRICTYMYVFPVGIHLYTYKYEPILTIRTYTQIRTGYVQGVHVRIWQYI